MNISAIIKKENRLFLNSPITYVTSVLFLILTATAFFFFTDSGSKETPLFRSYFNFFPLIFIVFIPAFSMRSWAEEKKNGTMEILLTMPFREIDLVIGKFVSYFVFFLLSIIPTLFVPLTLSGTGSFDIGQIAAEYLGVILSGSMCIAVGFLFSSISSNQISAFLLSFFSLSFLVLIGHPFVTIYLPDSLFPLLRSISIYFHFDSFKKGILDSRDLLYFVLLTIFFLYLTIKTISFKKWE